MPQISQNNLWNSNESIQAQAHNQNDSKMKNKITQDC